MLIKPVELSAAKCFEVVGEQSDDVICGRGDGRDGAFAWLIATRTQAMGDCAVRQITT